MKVEGECHCGQVQFTAEVDPARVTLCHCTDCQQLSGAPCRAVVPAPIESFAITGETRSYVKVAASGNRRAQIFCPTCATPLYACAEVNPPFVNLRLGCVRQRNELIPVAQGWQRSALAWVRNLDAIPAHAGSIPAPSAAGKPR